MGGVAKIFYNFLTCQKYSQIYFRIFCIFGKIFCMAQNPVDLEQVARNVKASVESDFKRRKAALSALKAPAPFKPSANSDEKYKSALNESYKAKAALDASDTTGAKKNEYLEKMKKRASMMGSMRDSIIK